MKTRVVKLQASQYRKQRKLGVMTATQSQGIILRAHMKDLHKQMTLLNGKPFMHEKETKKRGKYVLCISQNSSAVPADVVIL
jgi:hypothetical protein